MSKTYMIKECFYSPQGEGHRIGTMNVFLRFSGCNLQCVDASSIHRTLRGKELDTGFNCDTDFQGGNRMTAEEIVALVKKTDIGHCMWVIFTGGEPTLQLDVSLCKALHLEGYSLAIETNGTGLLPGVDGRTVLDYVAVSPKPGAATILRRANEVRCVIKPGQPPDLHKIDAVHKFVSPAADAPSTSINRELPYGWKSSAEDLNGKAMRWAVEWCEQNPSWRISIQTHKILGVR